MDQFYSLLSVVFMMAFFVLFEKLHDRRAHGYGLVRLMTPAQAERMVRIAAACQEAEAEAEAA